MRCHRYFFVLNLVSKETLFSFNDLATILSNVLFAHFRRLESGSVIASIKRFSLSSG